MTIQNKIDKPQTISKTRQAKKLLPPVSIMDNKASRGRCLLLAGSEEYPGAGILAAKAALRMGSGYVILAQKNIRPSLENPDFLLCDLNKKSWSDIKFDSILVGPGFGVNDFTASVIQELKDKKIKKVILDADAITVCAEKKDLLPLPSTWIITPHTGELARVLKVSAEQINQDRLKYVRLAQKTFQCVVLLKGHKTLIANSKRTFAIGSGNAALAKAGTGDVLSGCITALRAQGLSPTRAALLGSYAHGATANLWSYRKKDLLSMTASDVIDSLPEVLYKIRFSE
ncbi:MAG: NAD(P)H-hydrate dehydratase [Bdellovibrio sp.]